ncbi:Uncharacterised protein [Streptococcus pneumoniae]|nr:Uncharacterised protein [Streptococcus pneumoniae]
MKKLLTTSAILLSATDSKDKILDSFKAFE